MDVTGKDNIPQVVIIIRRGIGEEGVWYERQKERLRKGIAGKIYPRQ
jgi:hypothetical protein